NRKRRTGGGGGECVRERDECEEWKERDGDAKLDGEGCVCFLEHPRRGRRALPHARKAWTRDGKFCRGAARPGGDGAPRDCAAELGSSIDVGVGRERFTAFEGEA